jgi:hypothetical protein
MGNKILACALSLAMISMFMALVPNTKLAPAGVYRALVWARDLQPGSPPWARILGGANPPPGVVLLMGCVNQYRSQIRSAKSGDRS